MSVWYKHATVQSLRVLVGNVLVDHHLLFLLLLHLHLLLLLLSDLGRTTRYPLRLFHLTAYSLAPPLCVAIGRTDKKGMSRDKAGKTVIRANWHPPFSP